jgi:hypothetical protein
MSVLHLENIPLDVYRGIEEMARREKRAVAEQAVELLRQSVREQEVRARHDAALADLRRRRRPAPEGTPDSVQLLREDRER